MSDKGKPIVKVVTRITKDIRMVMTGDQVKEALTAYLNKNFREFRGMDLEFDIVDDLSLEIEVVGIDEKEERSGEGTKSGGTSTSGTTSASADSPTERPTETEQVSSDEKATWPQG
jgi:hypothetical protein